MSLDVFRGATIASMILVNNPGNWSALYGPLDHAEWHGWTFTDLIRRALPRRVRHVPTEVVPEVLIRIVPGATLRGICVGGSGWLPRSW